MIAVDLFCGAGGLTRGLMNAGVKVLLGIDINGDCRDTYEANNRPASFVCGDVRKIATDSIRARFSGRPREPLLLAGCAPCQPFSSHRRSSSNSSQRNLLSEVARIASELAPEWIFIENVPGIRLVQGNSTYRRFKRALQSQGYSIAEAVVDAKYFGVPQTRRRLVLIASLHCNPTLPDTTHGAGRLPFRTVRSAIERLPKIRAGERHPSVSNHSAASLTEINLERLRNTPQDGGGRLDWPARLKLSCHKSRGHEDVYGRMKWDTPAPTLTCRCFSISNGRYGHPEQDRAISFREAATIQSFPEDFVFFGESQKSLGVQIGNAVPVLLAEAIGKHILELSQRPKNGSRKNS